MLIGVLVAFTAMLSFGVGDSLFNIPAKKYQERIIVFWQYIFILLFTVLFAGYYFQE